MGKRLTKDEKAEKKLAICRWIAEGHALAAYCRETKTDYSCVMDWLREDATFATNYARAREAAGDADADGVSDIRARVIKGEIPPDAARVAIDALKWTAARRQPKKYGDSTMIKHADAEGGVIKLSPEDAAAKVAALLAELK